MYVSKVKKPFVKFRKARVCQGDILRDLQFLIGEAKSKSEAEFDTPKGLEYAIIMNQDCDLSQDFKQRSKAGVRNSQNVRTILICPAYPAQKFFKGTHIPDWEHREIPEKEAAKVRSNDTFKRYHYLAGEQEIGVPEVVLDFKHFYTVPVEIVYRQRKDVYIATINELYREELSQRFAYFLEIGRAHF